MNKSKLKQALKAYELKSVHPAADVFPMMGKDEYDKLVASVKAKGFATHGVCTPEGVLIDGRNRICASMDADLDLVIDVEEFRDEEAILDFIVMHNVERRHMTGGQLAAVAVALLPMYEKITKEKQREHGKTAPGRKKTLVADRPQVNGKPTKARDMAAEAVGAKGRTVQRAAAVKKADPTLFDKVASGEVSLDRAAKQVKARQKQLSKLDPAPQKSVNRVSAILLNGKEVKLNSPKLVKFNRTNDSVDWASWTWNPVTGCNHGCEFCYAREIAHSSRMAEFYPKQFEPTFHPYRLVAPENTTVPTSDVDRDGRVFVCSMADLFGKWVPQAWIRQVFDACLKSPEWEYLFLTKWPARYSQMPLIERAWYGASIVRQSDVKRVSAAMRKMPSDNVIRWVSMEPMLSEIRFDDLSWCDLMVIGSQTATSQPSGYVPAIATPFDWVVDVVNQCREHSVPYYLKANLGNVPPGMALPKSSPKCTAVTANT